MLTKSKTTSRFFCFTSFSHFAVPNTADGFRYLIMGYEVCPTTGREHIQAYVEFWKPVYYTKVKELFG